MKRLQKKLLSALLACLLLFSPVLPIGVPRADAITADQIESAITAIQKLQKLSQIQAQQAVVIAETVVKNSTTGWLSSTEIANLKAKGLTKAEVSTALDAVSTQISSNWTNLTSQDSAKQLSAVVTIVNDVETALGKDFINNLKSKGITTENLVVALMDLVEVQISSWDNLPKDAIEKIFSDNSEISQATAAAYGLNWENVQEILDSLSTEQKNQLKDILVALGSWYTPSGGGGGGGGPSTTPATSPVNDQQLKNALEQAAATGKVVINAAAGQSQLALSISQFKQVQDTGKPLQANIGSVSLVVPPAALPSAVLANATQVQFGAAPVAQSQVQQILSQAANSNLFSLAGDVFELSVTAITGDGKTIYISNFNGKVQVALPVPERARELAAQGRLTVCRYNEQTKTWENMGGAYNSASGTITFETDRFSKYAVMEVKAAAVQFKDIAGHWAKSDIEFMASKGFVGGVGNGLFAPEANITRAQFAAFLVRILGVTETGGTLNFSDVKAGDWYYNSLAAAYNAGLIKGVSKDKIAPNANITREEMAAMIVRATQYKGKTVPAAKELTFTDKSAVSGWAAAAISQSAQLGLVGGFPDGSFAPKAKATRAQAIVILKRVYSQIQ